MVSSWSGFQPQNEIVKLQWTMLEACQFEITAREFRVLLESTGLSEQAEPEELLDDERSRSPSWP
jgi:hypothetical protein